MSGNMLSSSEDPERGWEQRTYLIRTPDNDTGLGAIIEAFRDGAETIVVKVSRERGHRTTVRITPDRDASSWQDPIFLFMSGKCQQLNACGSPVGAEYDCSGRINTQVTTANENAGELGILYPKGEPHL